MVDRAAIDPQSVQLLKQPATGVVMDLDHAIGLHGRSGIAADREQRALGHDPAIDVWWTNQTSVVTSGVKRRGRTCVSEGRNREGLAVSENKDRPVVTAAPATEATGYFARAATDKPTTQKYRAIRGFVDQSSRRVGNR